MKPRLVAIEGPIGVGKTALARRLCRHWDARLLLEPTENPFLESFYKDRRGSAFAAQIWFLLARHRQQRDIRQGDLFQQAVVSDYLFEKDLIFAYLNLNDIELATYEKLYQLLKDDVVRPDIVIYLQARASELAKRVAERGREVERRLSETYLEEVVQAYDYFFFRYDQTPLLVVDTNRYNPAKNDAEFEDLVRRISAMDRGGVEYYSPSH
ncbi:MAG: deoxynucleoside kinase [Candidatus Polarisedimenticolia bacterium]|nr:deoxynucleoside kinase [bacterium]